MSLNLDSDFRQFNFGMDNGSKHSIYGFDRFRLDAKKLMLYDGDQAVRLPPKCVNTLAVLVENAGEIISKDELIDAVWQDSIVEESNLSQYLYLLRKTLGTRKNGQPYIETLRRRGYRFNGEPALIKPQPKPQPPARVPPARVLNFSVEPRGNVVALTEWKEAEQIKPDAPAKIALAPQPPPSTRFSRWAVVCAFLAVLVISGSGYLLFNRNAIVTADPAREITNLRLTNGLEPMGATISPDGKYFVYHEQSGPVYRLWLQQTGFSSRVEIIPASEKPLGPSIFSPDSQFVYFLATESPDGVNSLYRVPTLGGPVAKIITGINLWVSFSPDGSEMVYSRFDKQKNETQFVIRASGSSDERIILALPGPSNGNPAWAPDGNTIVFAKSIPRDVSVGTCMLESLDLKDGTVKPASDERWDTCYRMAWKPDGRGFYLIGTKEGEGMTPRRDQLYFVSYPEGRSRKVTTDSTSRHQEYSLGVTNDGAVLTVPYNRASQIWAMNANGDSRSAVQLTSGVSDGRAGLAPRADGSIAYVTRSADNLNISVMNGDGSDQRPIVVDPPVLEELRSSRGSRHMVYSSRKGENYSHLFRVNLDGSDPRQLTFGDSYEVDSSISNDGNWVAYGSSVLHGMQFDVSLWKIPIDGGEPIPLNQRCEMPHFSPDDKLLSCIEGQKMIHVLSAADGTLLTSLPVPPLAAPSFGARWTPDGKSVTFIITEKGISNIWLSPVDGSESKPLTDFTIGSIYHFAFSTDGMRLFVARGQQIRDAVLIKEQTLEPSK
jgi:DNA-binding winged helix-turn-helix (wHTH) protein/Tol biopolymer transport system component